MWQLDGYLVIKRSDLTAELARFVEGSRHIVARIPHWIADGESTVLQQMLSAAGAENGGVDISHSRRLEQCLSEAFERRELIALCADPVPSGDSSGSGSDGSVPDGSVPDAPGYATTIPSHVSVFAMQAMSTRTQRSVRGYLPSQSIGEFDDDNFDASADEPPPESDGNWIFVVHQRGGPGDLDPETRKATDGEPVLSTAHIYEAGTQNEVATVKLAADGEPMQVTVPVGMTAFDVVFDDDFGGAYEIAHQPYANPFTDETPKPTAEQIAKIGSIGLLSWTPAGAESKSGAAPDRRSKTPQD